MIVHIILSLQIINLEFIINCDNNSDDPTSATKSAVTSRAKARVGWEIREREESLLIKSVVNSDYLYFCGIVVTSQTYAARVVHSNNKI